MVIPIAAVKQCVKFHGALVESRSLAEHLFIDVGFFPKHDISLAVLSLK